MPAPSRTRSQDGTEWADASGVIYTKAGKCRFCHEKLVKSSSLVLRDGWTRWYCETAGCVACIGRGEDVPKRSKVGRWR